jgi:hypothetical protein
MCDCANLLFELWSVWTLLLKDEHGKNENQQQDIQEFYCCLRLFLQPSINKFSNNKRNDNVLRVMVKYRGIRQKIKLLQTTVARDMLMMGVDVFSNLKFWS